MPVIVLVLHLHSQAVIDLLASLACDELPGTERKQDPCYERLVQECWIINSLALDPTLLILS